VRSKRRRWLHHSAAAALTLAIAGVSTWHSPVLQAAELTPHPLASTAVTDPGHPLVAWARNLGLPAGVLMAGGGLWLLFNQGKTLQENAEAWGQIGRGIGGRRSRRGPKTRQPTTPSIQGLTAAGRRFTVAFSYAGEDRARVAPVAETLALRFGKRQVLYDRFHQAEFARANLDVYLPPLYRDQSDLIVVVLSADYPRKAWCGLELRWIRQLLLGADSGRIMLLSIGDPGDLSNLGILPGDGYLNIVDLPDAIVSERILERLSLQGGGIAGAGNGAAAGPEASALPLPLQGPPGTMDPGAAAPPLPPIGRLRWPWSGRRGGVALTALALGLPLTGVLGRVHLARFHLEQGDQAFLAYAQTQTPEPLDQAGRSWQLARQLDPSLAAAHARLGFLSDFLGQRGAAEAHWRQAIARERPQTPAARSYRVGLANVLAQQPTRRQEAIEMFEADVRHPRSAIELAMLRWPTPRELPQALDAVSHPEVAAALGGPGAESDVPWGFTLGQGEVLLFKGHSEQGCLLRNVKATTAQLITTESSPPPLTGTDCQGLRESVKDLLCLRLRQASATNPRATATSDWLTCPSKGRDGPPLGTGTTG